MSNVETINDDRSESTLTSNTSGKESGAELCCLSGWSFTAELWKPWLRDLGFEGSVLTPEYPDYAADRLLTREERVAQIAHLIEAPVVLLGWSLGGAFAIDFADRYPDRVKAVILLASNPCFVSNGDWPGMEQGEFNRFQSQVETQSKRALRGFNFLVAEGSAQPKSVLRGLGPYQHRNSETLAGLLSELQSDRRSICRALSMPVHVLLGERDALVPIQLGDHLVQLGFEVSKVAGGHYPFEPTYAEALGPKLRTLTQGKPA